MIGAGVAKLIERGFRASGNPLEPAAIEALVPSFMEVYAACATDNTIAIHHIACGIQTDVIAKAVVKVIQAHSVRPLPPFHANVHLTGFFGLQSDRALLISRGGHMHTVGTQLIVFGRPCGTRPMGFERHIGT